MFFRGHLKYPTLRVGLYQIPCGDADLFKLRSDWTKLSPSERALFTRRRKEIYEALHPETRQGGVGRGGYKDDKLSSFSEDTASKTGQNRRTVERDASRGERVTEDALDVIRGTSADKGVVLDRLAAAPKDEQVEMTKRIILPIIGHPVSVIRSRHAHHLNADCSSGDCNSSRRLSDLHE